MGDRSIALGAFLALIRWPGQPSRCRGCCKWVVAGEHLALARSTLGTGAACRDPLDGQQWGEMVCCVMDHRAWGAWLRCLGLMLES